MRPKSLTVINVFFVGGLIEEGDLNSSCSLSSSLELLSEENIRSEFILTIVVLVVVVDADEEDALLYCFPP